MKYWSQILDVSNRIKEQHVLAKELTNQVAFFFNLTFFEYLPCEEENHTNLILYRVAVLSKYYLSKHFSNGGRFLFINFKQLYYCLSKLENITQHLYVKDSFGVSVQTLPYP